MLRLLGVLVFVAVALFGISQSGWLDRRPVQQLLFVGHSRTYHNQLPEMVARIADSAEAPVRYEVTMRAAPGASLKDHWQSSGTRALLTNRTWDRIIIQPNVVWRGDDSSSDFMTYGKLFVAEAAKVSEASVVVDWPLRDPFYRAHDWNRADHVAKTGAANRRLARESGADLIDVAGVWEDVSAQELPFSLYKDNDHPSVEGTYLVALVIAAKIADIDPTKVDYTPSGMRDEHAVKLRELVRAAVDHVS